MAMDPKVRRLFVTGTIGTNRAFKPLYGLQAGIIGRTGAYLSTAYSFKNAVPEIEYELDRDIVRSLTDIAGYYYEPSSYGKGEPNDKVFNITITLGLTSQLGKNFFVNYGVGYSERNYYVGLKKYKYEPDSNYIPDYFNFETAYGLIIDETYKGMNGQLGFIKRFKNNMLVSVNGTFNFDANKLYPERLRYKNTDLLLSVGYCF
jgi:hypothetical protein